MKHELFPFEFDNVDDPGELEQIIFYDVVWLADFTPFTKGQKFETMIVFYTDGRIEAAEIIAWFAVHPVIKTDCQDKAIMTDKGVGA